MKKKYNQEVDDINISKSIHNDKFLNSKCKKVIMVLVMFIVSVTTGYASPVQDSVTIVDGDNTYKVYTDATVVGDIIEEQGIEIKKSDFLYPHEDSVINSNGTIFIKRLKKLDVNCDGKWVTYWTDAETYGEFMEENRIELGEEDYYVAKADTPLETSGNTMAVVRVSHKVEEITEEIPFGTKTENDSSLTKGKKVTKVQGVPGTKTVTYDIKYSNGTEIGRTVKSETITKEPVDEVVSVGTAQPAVTASAPVSSASSSSASASSAPAATYSSGSGNTITVNGQTISYKKSITCSATAYDLSFESTGKRPGDYGYGITASGTYCKRGTVAVDPRVIPLGTKMFIVSADGSIVYGYCTAEDTGGAIKGNKVDLFYNSRAECMQFGRRNVIVYIL